MIENKISLVELNSLVRRSLESCLPDTYWVQAELSDVRTNATGHCYLEFIQKDERSSSMLAKARGIIWSNVFGLIKPYFEELTGQTFHSGLKVLVEVSVNFHELYGYSLTVHNIDPTYTLGDLVQQRQKIIKQLENEGVLTLNKELEMPILAQRIAVISSATAAGYDDFCNQLKNNKWEIPFYAELFPAIMQGDQVEKTILNALDSILERGDDFDVVVIIRGGGASSDLSGFDTYLLAASCAQYPLPIITGIGHERDDTVLDVVANTRVKTPTAAAEFLIDRMVAVYGQLKELKIRLNRSSVRVIRAEQQRFHSICAQIPAITRSVFLDERHRLERMRSRLKHGTQVLLTRQKHDLDKIALQVKSVSPFEILKKGYALVISEGKIVSSVDNVSLKDELVLRLGDGELVTTVKHKIKNHEA